jgi:hypothetical protein
MLESAFDQHIWSNCDRLKRVDNLRMPSRDEIGVGGADGARVHRASRSLLPPSIDHSPSKSLKWQHHYGRNSPTNPLHKFHATKLARQTTRNSFLASLG